MYHSFFLFISRGKLPCLLFQTLPRQRLHHKPTCTSQTYARMVFHECQLAVGCERSPECQYQCPLMVRPAAVLINYTWPTHMFTCAGGAVTLGCGCKAPFCASAPHPCRYVEESESRGRGGFRHFLINMRSSVSLLTAFQLTPLPLPL